MIIFQNNLFSDVTFAFPDDSAPPIHAHRVTLMAKSDFFYRMFNSGMQESKEGKVTITIHGIHFYSPP